MILLLLIFVLRKKRKGILVIKEMHHATHDDDRSRLTRAIASGKLSCIEMDMIWSLMNSIHAALACSTTSSLSFRSERDSLGNMTIISSPSSIVISDPPIAATSDTLEAAGADEIRVVLALLCFSFCILDHPLMLWNVVTACSCNL